MFKHGRKEQQISLDDRFLLLPQSILESLQKGWAEDFYKNIFLRINEDRFSVLYRTSLVVLTNRLISS